MIEPKNVKEIAQSLEPIVTAKLSKYGFARVAKAGSPLFYARPEKDGCSVVLDILVNGWSAQQHYLTVVVGIDEPLIRKQFTKPARLDPNSLICSEYVRGPAEKSTGKLMKSWGIEAPADFARLVQEMLKDALAAAERYAQFASLKGLNDILQNPQKLGATTWHDQKLMKILIPICEQRLRESGQ